MAKSVALLGAVAIVAPAAPPLGGMSLQAELLRGHLEREGIAVNVIPTNPRLPRVVSRLWGIRTLIQSVVFLCSLLRALPQAAVVHIFGASYVYFFCRVVPTLLVSRLMGKRVILNYRGGAGPAFFNRYGWVAWPIARLADAVTAPSRYLARYFGEHGIDCEVVPNIVDLERFRFRSRDVLQPHLLVSRNLEPMYNVELAIQAFEIVQKKYPNARLDILGSGSQETLLRRRVAENHISGIIFHGPIPNSEMPRFLDEADILLNPTNVDNFPMSLIEAFASGVPVVTTNVGGIRDLVGDDGAAILVAPNSASAIADEICRLLEDPGRARRMSQNAGRIAQQFSWSCVKNSLLKVYYPDQRCGGRTSGVAEEKI